MILLGKRIKELRNRHKLTQTELAEKVGVTKSTVAAYENDSRQPSYEVLIKMAEVFKVSIDSLLLNRSENTIDVSGLNQDQIIMLKQMISSFKQSNMIDKFRLKEPSEYERLSMRYSDTNNGNNQNTNTKNNIKNNSETNIDTKK